ncbi:N-acetyllactosaminide beta-1,3-N-acetylglucosaminyltransferase 3-like [Mugil cephalus]|uniref:N-acetyllactosaminide beta-1,3-N-acetylglucosaminyltransferase 3-like n=1 Tax=Mugil cephalus TaxID=48193 RepID=UPI001FB5D116|nr:N-acetyllactosaminide beta-1,3-N-acetylglucosaminyltransferase 3-like [Mugil cephalus]
MNTKQVITLLIIGSLFVFVFHHWNDDFIQPIKYFQEDIKSELVTPNVTRSYIYHWPKCQKNMSAEKISAFSSLPSHIKTFLYYRHCRHFPMLLDVPGKCGGAENSGDVFLLLVVKSNPNNYDRREVLRKTWGKERIYDGVQIRRVFISGTSGNGFEKERLNAVLRFEQREYNDILQWDFEESFFNLTLKQILFLEWRERNCPDVRFLFNGDDDVFAHTDNMVDYLKSFKDNNGSGHLYAGYLFPDEKPVRWMKSKYYVPVQVQEPEVYPPYCGGGGYVLSGYTASVIYNMSKSITVHPIDDAYMGMCLAKAELSPVSHQGFKTLGITIPSKSGDQYDPCFYRDLLVVHRFFSTEMYFLWHKLHEPDLKCEP